MQRRRFITILGTALAGVGLNSVASAHSKTLTPVRWNGYTLGAEGSFTLYTDDRLKAQRILKRCFTEIRRLEKVFSLYDAQSEISRLNRDGRLSDPSADWCSILDSVTSAYQITDGLFDPTIQPLWTAYSETIEVDPKTIARAEWGSVEYNSSKVAFTQAGTAITLNGIAQGYITDRITEILKNAGYEHVLVELGETRAIGRHPEDRPWNLGIRSANAPSETFEVAELDNQALATSGGYGSKFSENGEYHHLINPKTGKPGNLWKSLSVIAPTAAEADALSTGLSFANKSKIAQLLVKRSDLQIFTQV
ncbi:MAG: FAD:protein FMN transferase [Opitutaceae bacterium]